MKFREAGAINTASNVSSCDISGLQSDMTSLCEAHPTASGVMTLVAAVVIMTVISAPCLRNSRHRRMDSVAAMPPVMPRAIFRPNSAVLWISTSASRIDSRVECRLHESILCIILMERTILVEYVRGLWQKILMVINWRLRIVSLV